MNSADPTSLTDEYESLPVARIDAQDEPYVLPLREFLESRGVVVCVNTMPTHSPAYHLVAGDIDFVKKFFYRTEPTGAKRLGIVLGFSGAFPAPEAYQAKIFLTDPTQLSTADVSDLFEYFFTGEHTLLDHRRGKGGGVSHIQPPPPKRDTGPLREDIGVQSATTMLLEGDKTRIGDIIADVFGEDRGAQGGGKKGAPTQGEKKRRRKQRMQWARGILLGLGLIILPAAWYLLSLGISALALFFTARAVTAGDIDSARWKTSTATHWTRQASFVLRAASFPLSLVGWQEFVRGQERFVSFLSDTERAASEIQSLLGVSKRVAQGLLNQVDVTSTGTTSASDIGQLRTSLSSVQNTLGLAQAELSLLLTDRTFPFSVSGVSQIGTRAVSSLSTLRSQATHMDELLSLFLQISGFTEPKTYLVLLQNSMELRPTGGFIGSVAVATFADGRLTNFDIQDVYTFDGQLKGHVDPPEAVRELLGTEHWYLRDSNWDPDFRESGGRAAWFYEKETGNTVDGVFAVNTPFVAQVLGAVGPIDLADYNDRITADNFYGKSLFYTQNNFFPGSTQKKDFLGTLARALMEKITTGKGTNITKLFSALTTAISAHDVLMMFTSSELQAMVEHLGWAGQVPTAPGCNGVSSAICRFDPLAIVEANMGVNKVNYFIRRTITRQITIDRDGSLEEAVTLTITNTSGGEDGKPYRTYVRFLLPQGSSVKSVVLDEAAIGPRQTNKTPLVLPYVDEISVLGESTVSAVALDILPGAEKQLTITYTLPPLQFGSEGAILDLFDQKQPGVSGTPARTIIRYPHVWTAGMEDREGFSGREFIAKDGQIEYNTILDADELTRIRLTK